ncbi:MAG: bifunctional diaminohydroxyphosphoribosylaminopyrimidine deaminase/5-amino-6-(5-phosphoribosylamino)uracil reductase RibD [Endomicrobia bacterium]|nr:bifunctional diaminohydroxyphosphoribosylaminopyrimidine deaminase/5-amino-6-(5-phosphoribosylamino)uracil reductase RibD [Endomicrobiia bacterium]
MFSKNGSPIKIFGDDRKKKYMQIAIELAEKGEGRVFPNPKVGCVIVKNGKVVGKGYHEYFGGNHAEINALASAGVNAKGSDMYVTLEPCNAYGKRPPCTRGIIKAGIKRVFAAVKDPNVLGSRKTLGKNGVEVHYGLLSKKAKKLIKDYFVHLKEKTNVSVKAAMTLDGKIATYNYDSKWITSEKSRDYVHKLRSKYDAVLVGTNTAMKDNPFLTSHNKGRNPVRVVIDSKLKLPKNHHLLDGSVSTVVIYDENIKTIPQYLKKDGIILAGVNMNAAKKDFKIIIDKLAGMSLKKILIEGGGDIISSSLFSNVVDDIYFFVAPKIIGGKDAVSVVGGKGVAKIKDAVNTKNMKVKKIGPDLLITGKLK